jgi:hypothetical protein
MAVVAPEAAGGRTSGAAGQAVARFLGDDGLAQAMHPYLGRVEFEAGARVIEQGAVSDDIYFIEVGEGIVQLEPTDAAPVKLAAFDPRRSRLLPRRTPIRINHCPDADRRVEPQPRGPRQPRSGGAGGGGKVPPADGARARRAAPERKPVDSGTRRLTPA